MYKTQIKDFNSHEASMLKGKKVHVSKFKRKSLLNLSNISSGKDQKNAIECHDS